VPGSLARAWSFDPIILATMAALAIVFLRGARARKRHAPRASSARSAARPGLFVASMVVFAVALITPIAALGETLFAGHMVQHVLLTMVAAPLLVASDIGTTALWALPLHGRKTVGRALLRLRPAWHLLTQPVIAWTLHLGTLVFWHWPPAYEAAVRSHALHAVEHVSFVATAIPFWWNLVAPRRRQRLRFGGALLYLFTASLVGALMGALITMSRVTWYPVHARGAFAWGLTPLEDQQLAGLIMWIPAGMIYLFALIPLAVPALRQRAPAVAGS
jgi:putative membrane protein